MFNFEGKEYSDQEVGNAYWEKVKERMTWCREKAAEFVKKGDRKAYYRMDYWVDPGVQSVYAAFTDKELKIIKEAVEDDIRENGAYEDENQAEESFIEMAYDMAIDFYKYIPEEDLQWAGGPPQIRFVDFEDAKHVCRLKIKSLQTSADGQEDVADAMTNIGMTDEVYTDLLAARLFDNRLTFYDLKTLYPEIYKKISNNMFRHHQTYMIILDEINEAAKKIIDETTDDYKPFAIEDSNPFIGIIWNNILNDKELSKADPALAKAFRLAIE